MSEAMACHQHEFDDGHWEGSKYVRTCTRCGIRTETAAKEVCSPAVVVELPPPRESEDTPGE